MKDDSKEVLIKEFKNYLDQSEFPDFIKEFMKNELTNETIGIPMFKVDFHLSHEGIGLSGGIRKGLHPEMKKMVFDFLLELIKDQNNFCEVSQIKH